MAAEDQFAVLRNPTFVLGDKSLANTKGKMLRRSDFPFENRFGVHFVDILSARARGSRITKFKFPQRNLNILGYFQHGDVFLAPVCRLDLIFLLILNRTKPSIMRPILISTGSRIGSTIVAFVIVFFFQTLAVSQTEDWPQFLGPRQNGTANDTNILRDWSGDQIETAWTLPVGEGYSIGSVAGGCYFHFDAETENGQSRLRCINLETGKLKWEHSDDCSYKDQYGYDSGPRSSPLIHDGLVYIFGVDGWLRCLDANDGSLKWEHDTGKKFGVLQNFFGVASNPIIHDDSLLVMIGGSPADNQDIPKGKLDLAKPNGSAIVAFDRKTGKVKYKTGDDLASYTSLRLVELHQQPIALAWLRESLIGFRPGDGEVLFKFRWRARKLESVNASTPVVDGNKIFLSESYGPGGVQLAVDAAADKENKTAWSVKEVWSDKGRREKSIAAHWSTPVLHDGFLFGCSGQHGGSAEFRCVRWSDGKVMWAERGLGRTSATLCGEHLIILSERGRILLVKASPESFQLVTEYKGDIKFRQPCWAGPVVAQGKLIVRGKNKVVCFPIGSEKP